MIIDSQALFSSAQDLTGAGVGDTASTNVLDTGADTDDGVGEELFVEVNVSVAVTSAGAATVQYVLQTSTDNATWTDLELSEAIAKATLVIGYTRYLRVNPGVRRYLRVVYRIGTAALTAGKVTAGLVKNIQLNKPYAIGYSVG